MKIDSNTKVEEVKKETKEAFVRLCSTTDVSEERTSAEIEEISMEEATNLPLANELLQRILGIQELISVKKKVNISMEEVINFLDSATSYDELQIWLADVKEESSKIVRIKALLSRTSDNDILRLYDIEQNYNQNNLDNITKMLDSPKPEYYGMQVNESGDGITPTITKESRKILAKSLID